MTDKDPTDDPKDKDPQGGSGDVPAEAGKVADQLEQKQEEAEKLEEKLNEPGLTDRERDKVGERLDALDSQMAALGEKLDKLISSPVAPSPRRAPEGEAPKDKEPAGGGGQPPKDKDSEPPAKPPFSKAWWGNRAAG